MYSPSRRQNQIQNLGRRGARCCDRDECSVAGQLSLLPNVRRSAVSCSDFGPCGGCKLDQQFLQRRRPPAYYVSRGRAIRLVDLFCGCGGMTLGLTEGARRAGHGIDVALALDSDPNVIEIYKRNFDKANARTAHVEEVFDGMVGGSLSESERLIADEAKTIDVLVGGPPCQGHSDLNNRTRRNDPKNALYLRMARAAEVLKPRIIIIENVTAVQWDKSDVVRATIEALTNAGYKVCGRVVDLRKTGVPQRRRRFVLIASSVDRIDPAAVFAGLETRCDHHRNRTVRWAIDDLSNIKATRVYDTASRATDENARRIEFLFKNRLYDLPNDRRPICHRDGGHSYVSVYGRLRWNQPAQTITTGFGCIGQGRYIHPQKRRTITPHEAARLQTFPDWFDFGEDTRRGVLAKTIGNAVPPLLTMELARIILPSLPARRGTS